MPPLPRRAVLLLLGFGCGLAVPPAAALTVLGTGTAALLGGDLTDPENDGNDATGTGFNWVSTAASSENYFGSEGALDVFDNQVGELDAKWCGAPPPQWVAVELAVPHVLTHFTLAAGNDAPERDPTNFRIEGSMDGTAWTTIFHWSAGVSPFSQRLEVVRFDGAGADFADPPPFRWFRYFCQAVDGGLHQINELELFGVPVQVVHDFSADKPLIPPGEPVTLAWTLDPAVTSASIDQGIGDVMPLTSGGTGSLTVSPGPATTTTYTLAAVHPLHTARRELTVTVTNQPVIHAFGATPAIVAPGAPATLRWQVFNAGALDLDGADVTGQTEATVAPAATTGFTLTATNAHGTASATAWVVVAVPGEPVISEFMAANDGAAVVDQDGDSSDWIEIHNPSAATAALGGYHLTDDPHDLQKWTFPEVELEPLGRMVVFASGKNRAGPELHTSFKLDADGGYLALVMPDGVTIVSEFGPAGSNYPGQEEGVSYGLFGTPPAPGYFELATPGADNSGGFLGFVADTRFSVDRGFCTTEQLVEITTATPGATIRYTTDGSWPSETHGTPCTGPVRITRTTPLRAIACKPGHRPTNVDTHTYVFPDDVITQNFSNTQSVWGLPASWNGQAPDYGMDSRVTSLHAATIRDDLRTVPTLSIVMDAADLFGGSGIYSHPTNSGPAWERPASLELIDPATPGGANDFQLNCGVRIQGGAFRSFGLTLKKSLRLLFKEPYGPTKLRHPLFGPDGPREFDTLVLRMESNDGYQWENLTNVQYARDEFARRTQLALGSPSPRGRHLHVYLNGVYWGLYNAVERPDASFGAAWFGADKDEWDGINSGTPTNDGSTASWNTLRSAAAAITSAPGEAARTAAYMQLQGLLPDGTADPSRPRMIAIDNYIDYLLVNWYLGNADWPHRNYYIGRERDLLDPAPLAGSRRSAGAHFFCWDAEWTMFMNSSNDQTGNYGGVCEPYGNLRNSLEFRVRFGDRAHRALFNGGALTAQPCLDRYAEVTADHRSILIPELARWGDQHGTLRTLQNWIAEYDHIRSGWLAVRAPALVTVLKGAGLYPSLAAPAFSPHGGPVTSATPVTIHAAADTLCYTTDGSDPRLIGGGISPAAVVVPFGGTGPADQTYLDTGSTWKYRDLGTDPGAAWNQPGFNDSGWASGPSSLGYGSDGEGAGTTVGYGPDVNQKYAATYFRTTVTVPDPGAFDHFLLRLKYDDAVGFFVNGAAVVLTANLPNGAASAYNQYATGLVDNEAAWHDYIIPTSALAAGTNTLAAQVHQYGAASTDLRFDVVLRGVVAEAGGNEHGPLFLPATTVLSARAYDSASHQWSALNQALFTVDVVAPDPANLVVSELNYHPHEPVAPGETAISTDRDDYEFIELLNIGPSIVDLSGVRFDAAITFTFPDHTFLPPGGRVLVVRHLAAFTARHGAALGSTPVAGTYDGRLSNDGEHVRLTGPAGPLVEFTYDDRPPWPQAADGAGASLTLVAPWSAPDHDDPASWRASCLQGGSPGTGDALTLTDWMLARGLTDPSADPDHDGLDNFGEFATGGDPLRDSSARLPRVSLVAAGTSLHAALEFRLSLAAADAVLTTIESSADLRSWADASADFVTLGQTWHADGTVTMTCRSTLPVAPGGRSFYRLVFRQR